MKEPSGLGSSALPPEPPVVNDQASSATPTVTSAIKIAISTRDIILIGPSDTQADLSPPDRSPPSPSSTIASEPEPCVEAMPCSMLDVMRRQDGLRLVANT